MKLKNYLCYVPKVNIAPLSFYVIMHFGPRYTSLFFFFFSSPTRLQVTNGYVFNKSKMETRLMLSETMTFVLQTLGVDSINSVKRPSKL